MICQLLFHAAHVDIAHGECPVLNSPFGPIVDVTDCSKPGTWKLGKRMEEEEIDRSVNGMNCSYSRHDAQYLGV